ncbi:MAG: hypothetical protein AAF340_18140 [Pseudomonadota bacterium]
MTQPHLEIFAVNSKLDMRHTFLSRASGDTPKLPDLAGWLGLQQGGVNTDEIELFPTDDLAGMQLSDYVTTAFDLEAPPEVPLAARMNALEGHVLLIPSHALAGSVQTGAELTLITRLPMTEPDHSASALKPVAPTPPPAPEPEADPAPQKEPMSRGRARMLAIATAFVLAVIIVFGREFF